MIEEYKAHHKKHQAPALKDVKRINKKTGKEYIVAGWSPIREGVVPIKEDTKLSDFKPIEEWARGKGLDVVRIDIHHDEGYKDEETGNIKFNRHAHIVFDWLDHQTGKTLKLNEQDMSELQDVVAKALDMERGESKAKTGAEHRDVEQQRIHADKQRIKAQQQQISDNNRELSNQEQEIESLKESLAEINNQIAPDSYNWEKDKNEGFQLGEMIEYLLDDVEESKNEALKTQQTLYAKEKELEEVDFRLSKAKKEVDTLNDTLESKKRLILQKNNEIRDLERRIEEKKEELRREPSEITAARLQGREEGKKMAVGEILNTAGLCFGNNDSVTTGMVGKDWRKKFDQVKAAEQNKMQKAYSLFQSLSNAVNAIRTFVFKIRYSFSEEEEKDIYKALDGKEENAPALREVAYNLGGGICMSQYASKWDRVERELRNIANGVREEEQQRNRGLRR